MTGRYDASSGVLLKEMVPAILCHSGIAGCRLERCEIPG